MRYLTILILGAVALQAGPVSITNPSFETGTLPNPCTGSGCTWSWTVPGWDVNGSAGEFHPSSTFITQVPDGSVVAFSAGGTISQSLSTALAASTLYTLKVDIVSRLDGYVAPATVQLFAGNTLLATGNGVQPTAGTFLTSTATYQSSATDPSIGQNLKIVLSASGNQADFDNVRLNADAATGIPEPSSVAFLLIGGIAMAAGMRRARSRK